MPFSAIRGTFLPRLLVSRWSQTNICQASKVAVAKYESDEIGPFGKVLATTKRLSHTIPIENFLDVIVEQKDNITYVDAKPTSTGREGKVIDVKTEACVLCKLNLKNFNYTDVMILSQYIKRDGTLATFHESKLCSKQYAKVLRFIKQAQRCNLIQRPADYNVPGPWHDLNTYLEPDRRRDQPMKIVKKQYWKL